MKKRIIAMVMVLLLLAMPALAEERIDLSTEGCDQFVDNLALPNGRVVFAGSAAVKGNYQDARARLLCLNPDGSVAWEYIHPAQGKCSFGNLELLPGHVGCDHDQQPCAKHDRKEDHAVLAGWPSRRRTH